MRLLFGAFLIGAGFSNLYFLVDGVTHSSEILSLFAFAVSLVTTVEGIINSVPSELSMKSTGR